MDGARGSIGGAVEGKGMKALAMVADGDRAALTMDAAAKAAVWEEAARTVEARVQAAWAVQVMGSGDGGCGDGNECLWGGTARQRIKHHCSGVGQGQRSSSGSGMAA